MKPLIIKHIAKGTTIYSDKWGSYVRINEWCDEDGKSMCYLHGSVNHSKNFVNIDNKNIYTNNIERLWGTIKDVTKRRGYRTGNGRRHSSSIIGRCADW